MKFRIYLKGKKGKAVNVPGYDGGIELVEQIWSQNNRMTVEEMDANVIGLTKNYTIELTEEQAREAGVFKKKIGSGYGGKYEVNVPHKFLNKYTERIIRFEKTKGGKFLNFNRIKLDEQKVVADWIEAGAPKHWEIDVKKVN